MLEHLEIKNYALIENLSVDFSDGFNVITGETGAGKSIILGALGLLMGEKADSSAVRTGTEELSVNAVVSIPEGHEIVQWLDEHGISSEDGTVIVRRSVKSNGRSLISVQGQIITRAELSFFADSLIDMHGQSEHQSLLLQDRQRKTVDSYSHSEALLQRCAAAYHTLSELQKEKEELRKAVEESRKQTDYLEFAVKEIKAVSPEPGEDDELKERVELLSSYEAVYESVSQGMDRLKEAKSALYDCCSLLDRALKKDSGISDYRDRIENVSIEVEDVTSSLAQRITSIDYSEDAVNQVQDRFTRIQRLKKKYGPSIEEVIAFAEKAEHTLEISKNGEDVFNECEKKIANAEKNYSSVASELTEKRVTAAGILSAEIEKTLKYLGMPQARFEIAVETDRKRISPHGSDIITFMISANPGEPLKEMREIASGGETSRIMLALKTVLAESDSIDTQIFDEVDSGIGGSVALSLADCICGLAKEKQVIAITHLATVASRASMHFVVTKNVVDGRTFSHLKCVDGEDRVHEIARMLSGDEGTLSVEHAKQLLQGNMQKQVQDL